MRFWMYRIASSVAGGSIIEAIRLLHRGLGRPRGLCGPPVTACADVNTAEPSGLLRCRVAEPRGWARSAAGCRPERRCPGGQGGEILYAKGIGMADAASDRANGPGDPVPAWLDHELTWRESGQAALVATGENWEAHENCRLVDGVRYRNSSCEESDEDR